MNKITLITINLLLLSGLVSKATNPCDWQGGVNVSKTPSYFPGDGVTVTFDPDAFFTFLWPEKWSAKSSRSFMLVAVNKGQTAEEALLENTPIVQEKYIRSYYIQYPCDAPPLEFGEYAWQIKNADGKTLLTTHFATYYNYDEEGTLVQIKKETERGIMTVKTTRQHIKTNLLQSQNP